MKNDIKFQTIHVVVEDKFAPAFLKRKRMAFKEVGRITAAIRPVSMGQFDVGFSFCSPKDLFCTQFTFYDDDSNDMRIKHIRNYRRKEGKERALARLNNVEECIRITVNEGERVSDKVRMAALAAAEPTEDRLGVPWMKNITFANLSPTMYVAWGIH